MKKVINVVNRVCLSIAIGGIAYAILRGFAHYILDYMESTGGLIVARDYMQADFIPALLAIVITGMMWHASEGLNE